MMFLSIVIPNMQGWFVEITPSFCHLNHQGMPHLLIKIP